MLLHSRFTMPLAPIYILWWGETKWSKVPCVGNNPMTRFDGTDPTGPETDLLTYWPPCLHILWWVLTLCNILINTWGPNVVSCYSGVTSLVQAQGNNKYMYYQTWDFVLLLLQPIAEAKLSVSWIWSRNSRDKKKLKITVKDRSLSSLISYSTVGRK